MSSDDRRNKASPRYPVPTIVSRRRRRGLRLKDPSYVADTPHDMWIALQRQEKFRSTMSAEELEAEVRAARELAELLSLSTLDRARYDGVGQLLAKTILEHYERQPQDVRLPEAVKRELGKSHPQLVAEASTPQWVWAMSAASRIWDGHQEDE
jgi:hypothetical protein